MTRTRTAGAVRFVGRLLAGLLVAVVLTLVSIQFVRITGENIAMARSLSSVQHDIASLKEHRRRDEREIRRLLDPQGAIPAIHDRLHLVGPNEAIIYVKRAHAGGQ